MKKLYSFLLVLSCFAGMSGLRAQDSAGCNAGFAVSTNLTQANFTVFDSLPGTVHEWDFGDGTPMLMTSNSTVSHQYNTVGTYAVTQVLIDSAANCRATATQYITLGPNCGVSVTFSSDTAERLYTFVANVFTDPGAMDTVTWTINDTLAGQGDTLKKYLSGGPYTVCAHLRTSDGCQSESCATINPQDSVPTPPPPPDTCSINIDAKANPARPNQYHFSVSDSLKYEDVNWSILPPDSVLAGPFAQRDLEYTFQDTGFYLVSVTAQEVSGCPVSAVQWIHIDSLPGGHNGFVNSYPNPASTQVTVAVTLNTASTIDIRVFNSMGGLALSREQSGYPGLNQVTVPLGDLPTGVYYIELRYGDTVVRSKVQKL